MFFKIRKLIIFSVVAVMTAGSLAGCNLKTGDDVPSTTQSFADSTFSCLSEITAKVDAYLGGKMTEAQVNGFAGCVTKALRDFEFYSKGKDQNGYSPTELVDFLNRHYLPKNKISPEFLRELMRIKVIVMGGDDSFITHAEFKHLLECIDVVRGEAVRHIPFIKLYGLHSTLTEERFNASRQTVRDAKLALQITAQTFSERLINAQAMYSMESLERLTTEVRKFLNWQQIRPQATSPNDLRNLVSGFKEMMTATSSTAIYPSDWRPLFTSLARVYGLYIEAQAMRRRPSLFDGEGLESLIEFADNFFATIKSTLQIQPTNIVTFESLNRMIDNLAKVGVLDFEVPQKMKIQPESIKPVLEFIVTKVLRSPSDSSRVGITLGNVTEAEKEFAIWADSQRYISGSAMKKLGAQENGSLLSALRDKLQSSESFTGLSDEHLNEPLKTLDLSEYFNNAAVDASGKARQIEKIVKSVRPMFRENDERVWLVPRVELAKYNIKLGLSNLSRLNLFGSLMRLLIRGYATPDRIDSMAGVTVEELEKFYVLIRPLGSDIKFFDTRNQRVGVRSFNEGNMFTFSGNGIQPQSTDHKDGRDLLTFNEGIELLAFIWSGGQVRTQFYDNAVAACGTSGAPLDPFGKPKIDRLCFFENFGRNGFKEIANLPHMQTYMNRMEVPTRQAFYAGLTRIAFIPGKDRGYIEMAEIATISTILHYVEVLFTIYDADHNGILDGKEVMASFPRFNVYLDQKVNELLGEDYDVSRLKAIFVFLVKNGRIPDGFRDRLDILWQDFRYFDDDPNQYVRNALIDHMGAQNESAGQFERVPLAGIPDVAVSRNGILQVLVMLNSKKAH